MKRWKGNSSRSSGDRQLRERSMPQLSESLSQTGRVASAPPTAKRPWRTPWEARMGADCRNRSSFFKLRFTPAVKQAMEGR
jgi:hypothetical protein